jgi:hypothetical protein
MTRHTAFFEIVNLKGYRVTRIQKIFVEIPLGEFMFGGVQRVKYMFKLEVQWDVACSPVKGVTYMIKSVNLNCNQQSYTIYLKVAIAELVASVSARRKT